jgi:hypothetical protein
MGARMLVATPGHADGELAYRTPVQLKLSPYPETIHNRLRFQVAVGVGL